jgi:transcriptional regulator with XRE-family HTH domain
MDQIKIGNFIAFLRKEQNLTQRELAERLGVTDRAVSKWENGRGMPDLSLLVPLCEVLNISVNELLCGERIEKEDLPEKAQDTLIDALTDSHKKAKTVKWKLVALLIALVALFVGVAVMFGIDVERMKNNEPVVFSTWGFDYVPPVGFLGDRVEQAIFEHLDREHADDLFRYDNEKWFYAMKVYLTQDKGDTCYVYAWVLEESYYSENGKILQGSGSSIPHRFILTEEDGQFSVIADAIPRDGSFYPIDMEELFPWSVRVQMDLLHHNGDFERLEKNIQQQAKLYFHES